MSVCMNGVEDHLQTSDCPGEESVNILGALNHSPILHDGMSGTREGKMGAADTSSPNMHTSVVGRTQALLS